MKRIEFTETATYKDALYVADGNEEFAMNILAEYVLNRNSRQININYETLEEAKWNLLSKKFIEITNKIINEKESKNTTQV